MVRKEKRRFLRFSKIIFLSLLGLFILIILLATRSSFFSIKQIEILGDKIGCADSDQLKNESGLYGQNFFLLNSKKLQERLRTKFICIKTVTVGRLIPDKVKLKIASRKPDAILLNLKDKQASPSFLIENIATPEAAAAQDSYVVDNEGVVFSKSIDNLDIPKIYIYDSDIAVGKKLKNSLINNSLKILDRIKKFGVIAKKSLIAENFFIINPDTMDPKIIFRLNDQIDIQLASLQLILTDAKIDLRELMFIDLRFDKPIVRFAPKKN
ncbi:MAG: FtsQ-type POTRA domain-containing protein [Candidatus Daviesbacteria bacterium]|nr:FtsQ-type POTRA domain-containing protein [Candidatus Daviesbacteria bacterium]